MTAGVEHHVAKGPVNIGLVYQGKNPLQVAGDEHGVPISCSPGRRPGLSPQIEPTAADAR